MFPWNADSKTVCATLERRPSKLPFKDMLSALKHFKDQTDSALPFRSVQPHVASEAGTWMGFPGSGGCPQRSPKAAYFPRLLR